MNIGFFVRHFTERGTEVAVFDYAKYNEELLNNKSLIICFTPGGQRRHNFPAERSSFDKFNNRFQIVEIESINEMPAVIREHNLAFFYTLTYGGGNDIYQFNNKALWGPCKTIKHCVFETSCPESDFYITVAPCVNEKYGTNYPVVPHIVDLPKSRADLRSELGIPRNAVVYGRHGGMSEFNLPFAYAAIAEHVNQDPNCYFVFMNTHKFYEHPRILYLEKNVNLEYKVKFINTCDAMIHGRQMGETFGLAVAEFSIKNKPVITCPVGDLEHIRILGDRAVLYRSKEELLGVFRNIWSILESRSDWNAHELYTAENVMDLFKTTVLDR